MWAACCKTSARPSTGTSTSVSMAQQQRLCGPCTPPSAFTTSVRTAQQHPPGHHTAQARFLHWGSQLNGCFCRWVVGCVHFPQGRGCGMYQAVFRFQEGLQASSSPQHSPGGSVCASKGCIWQLDNSGHKRLAGHVAEQLWGFGSSSTVTEIF